MTALIQRIDRRVVVSLPVAAAAAADIGLNLRVGLQAPIGPGVSSRS